MLNKYSRLSLLVLSILSFSHAHSFIPPALHTFKHRGASVLPTFTKNGKKWVILSREVGGKNKGTYDDFGGKRDPKEHPLLTAAREAWEEIIASVTMNKTLNQMIRYINPKNHNTQHVLALTKPKKYVVFITEFDRYVTSIKSCFYAARAQQTNKKFTEKDRIAFVEWDILKSVIVNNPHNNTLSVIADVVNPKTNKLVRKVIPLRPFLVIKLRPFFTDQPYTKGKNPKVRFY